MNKKNKNFIRSKNISWYSYHITQQDRENLHRHRAIVLWFTGLSGSGKSTLSNILEKKLHYKGVSTYVLDGDNIRYGLCNDLQFNEYDRYENIRRVGEVAKLMVDAGLVVLASFISPFRSERKMVRDMFLNGQFIEIFLDTPIEVCRNRDPKGLYKQTDSGKIKNFTGVDSPYEKPDQPDVYLNGNRTVSELIDQLLDIIIFKIFIKM